MSETPQPQTTSAAQVPPQTRGQKERRAAQAPPQHRGGVSAAEPASWVGWIVFAAMTMVMVGLFQVVVGLTALFNSGFYAVGAERLLVSVDFTAWGWTHIALGVIAVAAAFGLLAGQMWARVVGIALALVSSVVNLAFIAAFPIWSVVVITLDVLVIYAIAVHGQEAMASVSEQ